MDIIVSSLRNFSLSRTLVRVVFFNCEVMDQAPGCSRLMEVVPVFGRRADDGVVGDEEPGSGGEFIVVAD